MADKKKQPKTEKVLGQDPLAGLFEPEGEETDNGTTAAESTIETNDVNEPPKVAGEVELESETETETEAEVDQVAKPPEPAKEPEIEAMPVIEAKNPDGQTTEPPKAEEARANLDPEENNGVLDEIIVTIDQEIEQMLRVDMVADMGHQAQDHRSNVEEQHIIFTLAGTRYAVSAANVREVGELANLTAVPNVPDWLLGVTNLRGDVLSVVDLHTFLSLEISATIESLPDDETSMSTERELLIAHPRGDAALMTTGLIVDEVNDIRYLTVDRIIAPAAPIEDQIGPYLRGVYEYEEGLLVVLDFDKLLLSSDMRQFEPV